MILIIHCFTLTTIIRFTTQITGMALMYMAQIITAMTLITVVAGLAIAL
jgi:hypothetical protein